MAGVIDPAGNIIFGLDQKAQKKRPPPKEYYILEAEIINKERSKRLIREFDLKPSIFPQLPAPPHLMVAYFVGIKSCRVI